MRKRYGILLSMVLLIVVALILISCGKSSKSKTIGAKLVATSSNCNTPLWPCALHQTNAQLTVISSPSPLPFSGLVGVNQQWKTPYGTTVTRCTDVNTNTTSISTHSYEIQDSGGTNGQECNSNGTMCKILDADSGISRVMGIDPVHKVCTGELINSEAVEGSAWDATNADMDYTFKGTVIDRRTGFNNPTGPTTTQLVDLIQACTFSPALTSAPTWHSPLSTDGTVIVVYLSSTGQQNTGIYAAAYNLSTGGCQTFNTQTGTFVAKGYGTSGKATGTNGYYPFTIHDGFIYGAGWATMGGPCPSCPANVEGRYLWKVGSTTVNLITKAIGGHDTMGYTSFINLTDSPRLASRLATNVNAFTFISSTVGVIFPVPQETHCTWRNADWNETRPIWCSQVSQNEQMPIQVKAPLQQEVYGVDSKTGTFIRIAPTMTSGILNKFNFRTQNAIINATSKDAPSYVLWSSDVMGTLGNTDGKSTSCILGAAPPNECRSDVFIVFP